MENVSTSEEHFVIPDVEPNVEASAPTYNKMEAKTIEPAINIRVSSS